MKIKIIIILFIMCLLNTILFSQNNQVIIGSKNNQFSIKINNLSSSDITGLRVFPLRIPKTLKVNTSEFTIQKLEANSSVNAQFNFDVNTVAVVAELDTIDFLISSKEGKNWHKKIVFDIIPPTSYVLEQNYPNPFNPSTTISYSLPQQIKVTLKVFNILGQNVRTLVNEIKKPGKYEVTFNANDLASGVYLYTISTSEFSKTNKMIILK